jgi:phosphonopyruvate decarboxylase
MIDIKNFGNLLNEYGFDFFTGVPCSFLTNLINYSINQGNYTAANNEGDAIAIAAGAYLGGKKPVVLMQNSGLTNAISPLTSLNFCFRIPVLGFVSLRGEPGLKDEPQHELMGTITTELLTTMKIEWEYLETEQKNVEAQIIRANEHIMNKKPYFFVVRKNSFSVEALNNNGGQINISCPTRLEALSSISKLKDDETVILATTGKTGRELFELGDSKHNLYMVGSMGCVSSFGLGIALSRSDKKVVSIDGDAALLMRMGNMPIIGANCPNNLLHVLLDNNSNDSTGGQATVSYNVDFVSIAKASGYKNAVYANNIDEFSNVLDLWRKNQGLTFVHLRIQPGSKENLGRPTIKPFEVKERLISFLEEDSK